MNIPRRTFIRTAGLAAATTMGFPTVLPSRLCGARAPSKRVHLGCIGVGGQGYNVNLKMFLNDERVRVVAVCDAFRSRALRAQALVNETYGDTGCRALPDFREILADPSIDAVVISTPDHWHVPMSLMALEAGKDVFCEKPTLSIHEGRVLADAFAARGAVFQAGIEDRSSIHFHKMVEWVRNGAIGRLERVEVVMPAGHDFPLEDPVEPPEDLDWNLWQGPAPWHPYTPSRANAGHWRQISMYSKGAILDIGTHLVDTAQLGVNDPDVCPVEVAGTGVIPEGRLTDVPIYFDLTWRYGNGVELHVKNGAGRVWDPESCYLEFIGEKGWIRRKTWTAGLEASDPKILRTRYAPGESRHWPLPPREQVNFIDCVLSRRRTTYPAIDLHHMSTTLHMGVLCIELGRKLRWDPKTETFPGDDEANARRFRPPLRDWQKAARERQVT
ncbi:MAG: gfo/Idh/MocA family oxidoreductase [Verrucomicrobia bacterium]|nr:MAG: gfo/Idh/MocA family oxidoreductase [Verrucomicrobiota bacterium]